ncbi:DUF1128 family protein [Abyssicoccus albus]|uniref:Uncharacterized protein YfkK (UPF0435 family) n=1 Tax=Abyssicoccus albus TaxID=1817405 RepID=A0A1Q1G0E4_9BACL|nr:DUF1128 family protein [Abyssicoccus albus]AQL55823.1 hypothetical protein BVH56_02140 [Abyssicoccus albus]RPF55146.1 uncharacterized protein YfkK (UPF0435 family) [Abyssicoccus albus]
MTIEEIVEQIKENLNLVNAGVINPEDFDENKKDDLEDVMNFTNSRNNLSPNEREAVLQQLRELKK